MKKFIFCICAILILGAIVGISLLPNLSSPAATQPAFGRVKISVLDSVNLTPIKDATVCVVETREYYPTNSLGQTNTIKLLAKTPTNLNQTPPTKSTETYTLLVYKNGFFPHIYHGLKIQPNITKTGVVIMLTEVYSAANFSHTESYEYPSQDWSTELIKNYKK